MTLGKVGQHMMLDWIAVSFEISSSMRQSLVWVKLMQKSKET